MTARHGGEWPTHRAKARKARAQKRSARALAKARAAAERDGKKARYGQG